MNKPNPVRRNVLRTGAALSVAGTAPMFFVRNAFAADFLNDPGNAPTVTLGFSVAYSGNFAAEGADEPLAFELAVKHINGDGDGGMVNTLNPSALTGNGILGKKVVYVTGDTGTLVKEALLSGQRMIEQDRAVMLAGASTSSIAIAIQQLCQKAGVIFMAGVTHSNDTTGKDRRRNGFRHFFNAYMSGDSLGPVLAKAYGDERAAYHLSVDYNWGHTLEASLRASTEAIGWQTLNTVKTPIGAADFSQYIRPVVDSGADTLILNLFGADLINALEQATAFGLRDKSINGRDFAIIAPQFSRLAAHNAGTHSRGLIGSANWYWTLSDAGSRAFVNAFMDEYGFPPSQAAHTCYVQTLLYADACERAGTFMPCEVIAALEGHQFDGLGNGPTEYRAADHQCFKDVLVVRVKDNPSSEHDTLEIIETTPRTRVEYDPENPFFAGGELGDCNNGARF